MPKDWINIQPVIRGRRNFAMGRLFGCLDTVAQKRGAVCPPDALGSDLNFLQIAGTDSTGNHATNRLTFQIFGADHFNQQIGEVRGSLISINLIRIALVGDLNHGQSS